jgi:hypothetical protein
VGGWSSTTKTPHVTLRPKHRNGKGIDVSQESREINSGASGARNSGEGKTHLLFRVASGLKSIHPASLWQGTPRRFLPLLGDGRARPSLSCMRPASFTHTHTLGPAPTCALMLAAANGLAASSKRGLRCSVARSQMRLHCSAMHFTCNACKACNERNALQASGAQVQRVAPGRATIATRCRASHPECNECWKGRGHGHLANEPCPPFAFRICRSSLKRKRSS